VLLSWLKESGAYALLNATLSPAAGIVDYVQQETEKPYLYTLAALATLNSTINSADSLRAAVTLDWLQQTGLLGALSTAQNATGLPLVRLIAGRDAAAAPAAALESGAVPKQLTKPRVPYLPGLQALQNATQSGVDRLKSLVLLSWLKESGAYGHLQVINNATAAAHGAIAAAADAAHLVAATQALQQTKRQVDGQISAAESVVANATAQVAQLKQSLGDQVHGRVSEKTKAATAAVDARIAAAHAALAEALSQARALSDAKLAEAAAAKGGLQQVAVGVVAGVQQQLGKVEAALQDAQKQAHQLHRSLPAAAKKLPKTAAAAGGAGSV
jgi:hypothetical protein